MDKLVSWLILIIGILLILPLVGVTSTILDWIVALAVLVIGIVKLAGK